MASLQWEVIQNAEVHPLIPFVSRFKDRGTPLCAHVVNRYIFHDKPIHDKPIHDKPIHDKPIHDKPIHDKPIRDKAIRDKALIYLCVKYVTYENI